MAKFNTDLRYKDFPALANAIKAHRLARLALDLNRNPTTIYNLIKARSTECKIRRQLAPALKRHNETLRHDREHARRYHYQLARKSRTLEPAAELRQARKFARDQAHAAASKKRAINRIDK